MALLRVAWMPTRPELHRPLGWTAARTGGAVGAQRAGSSTSRGYGYRWQRARLVFLAQHPICDGPACEYPSNEVHHVIPHRGDQGLFWDVANWQALCKQCHSAETARETNERKRLMK